MKVKNILWYLLWQWFLNFQWQKHQVQTIHLLNFMEILGDPDSHLYMPSGSGCSHYDNYGSETIRPVDLLISLELWTEHASWWTECPKVYLHHPPHTIPHHPTPPLLQRPVAGNRLVQTLVLEMHTWLLFQSTQINLVSLRNPEKFLWVSWQSAALTLMDSSGWPGLFWEAKPLLWNSWNHKCSVCKHTQLPSLHHWSLTALKPSLLFLDH